MIVAHKYPLRRMAERIELLEYASIFSTTDCNSGYWQIELPEADRKKQPFSAILDHSDLAGCQSD